MNASVQYEKYSTYLRNEATSNNLRDFKLHKGPADLGDVRKRMLQVLDRFAGQQAENLNVHEDFALLRRIALPVTNRNTKTPGIRIEDPRMVFGGWAGAGLTIGAVLLGRAAVSLAAAENTRSAAA